MDGVERERGWTMGSCGCEELLYAKERFAGCWSVLNTHRF